MTVTDSSQAAASSDLLDSAARLSLALAAAQIGTWTFENTSARRTWNRTTKAIFGISPDIEPTRDLFLACVHPDDRDRHGQAFAAALDPSGSGSYACDFRIRRVDTGAERCLSSRGQSCFENGRFLRIVGIVQDVTERKLVEDKLRASEERFHELADNISQFAWTADGSGWTNWYNKRWFDFTGTTIDEVAGWGWTKVHHPDHVDRVVARIAEAFRTGEAWEDTFPLRGKDGQYRWFLSRALPIRDEAGRVVRWFGTNTDVTELRSAEDALRHSEARFRAVFQAIVEGVVFLNVDGEVEMANDAVLRVYGHSLEELIDPMRDLRRRIVHSDGTPFEEEQRPVMIALRTGEAVRDVEMGVPMADGSVRWRLVNAQPVHDDEGRLLGAVASFFDITDRRRAEQALRESEARFRGIYEHAATGIAITDMQGRFLQCNPAYARMLGYSEMELRDYESIQLVHPDDRNANRVEIDRLLRQEVPSFEIINRYVCKDGTTLWVRKFVSLLCNSEGRATNIMALVTDMTERMNYQQKIESLLREVNHRAKNMLAVVQAIARSTAASEADDFQERFSERIRALAAAHDLLVNSEWQGVDLAELVTSQLAPFEDSLGSRISANGPPLRISASAAQTLAMVVHELSTNAAKYGALANDAGHVEMSWSCDGSAFDMRWVERGGPRVNKPDRRGFGTVVLDNMARMALSADVSVDYAPEGLTWRLRCSADKIVAGPT
jgi:PAS domain S-box-containing protein